MRAPDHAAWEGKWSAHDAAQHADDPAEGRRPLRHRAPAGKAWMLRLAWFISTGSLLLGAIIIVLILSGHGPRSGG